MAAPSMIQPEDRLRRGRAQIVNIVVGVIVFGLGILGVSLTGGAAGPLDVAYRSLQLFVLDGGALSGLGQPYHWVLEVARFAAPAVTVSAIVLALGSLLAETARRYRATRRRGHSIVCGDSPESRVLATNLRRGGQRVALVTGTADDVPAGVTVVLGDGREPEVLRAAGAAGAAEIYTLASRDPANGGTDGLAVTTAVALAAGRIARRRRASAPATYAQVSSSGLGEALWLRATAGPGGAPIDFFSLIDVAARVLLTRYPVGGTSPVVIGTGDLGDAVRRLISHPDGVVHHADKPATATVDIWERAGHERIYVCLDREEDAVTTALQLAAGNPPWKVVVCLRRSAPFSEAIGTASRIAVFGVLDESCDRGPILEASLTTRLAQATESFAQAFHQSYLARAVDRGETPSTNPSLVGWDELPPHLRDSNRELARSVAGQLARIGVRIESRPSVPPFRFTSAELDTLARLEHQRWVRERTAAGFRYGPVRTDDEHPDLTAWADLSADAQAKDAAVILQLPALLSTVGFYLHRVPAAQ